MKVSFSVLLATSGLAYAQLDIPALLAQAVPALPTDPRFTDYKPPGKNDGIPNPCNI